MTQTSRYVANIDLFGNLLLGWRRLNHMTHFTTVVLWSGIIAGLVIFSCTAYLFLICSFNMGLFFHILHFFELENN